MSINRVRHDYRMRPVIVNHNWSFGRVLLIYISKGEIDIKIFCVNNESREGKLIVETKMIKRYILVVHCKQSKENAYAYIKHNNILHK